MSDQTKAPESAPKAAPLSRVIPPIEDSPAFQASLKDALGGAPTSIGMFQPVKATVAPQAPRDPAAPRRKHNPAFDGIHPGLAASRQLVTSLTQPLAAIQNAIADNLESAENLAAAVSENKLAKQEAELIGIDLKKVDEFLAALKKATS